MKTYVKGVYQLGGVHMNWDTITHILLFIVSIASAIIFGTASSRMNYSLDYLKRAVTFSTGLVFPFVAIMFATANTIGSGLHPALLFFQVVPALVMILLSLWAFVVSGRDESTHKKLISIAARVLTSGTIGYVVINVGYLVSLLTAYMRTTL